MVSVPYAWSSALLIVVEEVEEVIEVSFLLTISTHEKTYLLTYIYYFLNTSYDKSL